MCNSWHHSRRQALNIATFNEFHFSNSPIHFHYTPVDFQLITCDLWRYSISPSKPVGDKKRCVTLTSRLTFTVLGPLLRTLPLSTYATQCKPFLSYLYSGHLLFLAPVIIIINVDYLLYLSSLLQEIIYAPFHHFNVHQ